MEQNEDGNLDQIRDILFGAQARELNSGLSRIEERLAKDIESLRQHIREEADNLRRELQSSSEEHSAALAREAAALRESKVDRAALANLLKEMAHRINGDLDASPHQ